MNVVTIGNFDGVHQGHRHLLRQCRKRAGTGGSVIVVTFEPHPSVILDPDNVRGSLSSVEDRRDWLADAGADQVVVIQTTRELLQQAPREFLRTTLHPLDPGLLMEGPDFRFGFKRSGDLQTLREDGHENGYEVEIIQKLHEGMDDQEEVISSTRIRSLLESGEVQQACVMLGRPYTIRGRVIQGARRGRELGYPTANIDHGRMQLPGPGVYCGMVDLPSGDRCVGALSVGTNPTFGEDPLRCEAHLLDVDLPIDDYGWNIRVGFERMIRCQEVFQDGESLVRQIHQDIEMIRSWTQEVHPGR